ncbi:MAG: AAA family ATPase [Patescibacteria group bacterium]|nr:AAA family ATPase [Patescibacteria group bacterium]
MAYKITDLKVDFEHTYLKSLENAEAVVASWGFKLLRYIFTALGVLSLSYLLIGIFIWPSTFYVGLALISLAIFSFFQVYVGYWGFLANYIDRLHFKSQNVVDYLDLKVYQELKNSKTTVDSFELALNLWRYPEVQLFLFRAEIDPNYFKNLLMKGGGSKIEVESLLKDSLAFTLSDQGKHITLVNLFTVLAQKDPFLLNLLNQNRLEETDLKMINDWFKVPARGPFELKFTGGIARDWTVGYSPTLDEFSNNLAYSPLAKWQTMAHKKQQEDLKKMLIEGTKSSVMLVGQPGIGKRSMVIDLARDLRDGKCPFSLAYKRILNVNVEQILTVGKNEAGIREIFGAILNEVLRAGDVILYFDNFSLLCGGGESLGRANLTEILIPYLDRPDFKIIASISPGDFDQYISRNIGLAQFFSNLEMKEPSHKENIFILEGLADMYQYRAGLFFTYPAIIRIMELAREYLWKEYLPLSAINFMEKVAQKASASGNKIVNQAVVEDAFEKITHIKVGEIKAEEKEVLTNLEELLHKRIVDQVEPIKLLAQSVRIKRAGIKTSKKPIGSFLFLGPTGVGKTETAKALAATYFGKEEAMIRFDMSEYQNRRDIYRLLGDPKTMSPGQLIEAVKNNPFSLILFDEFEKANKDILNLFLQILDEGFITDVFGAKIYFRNNLIVATSNAGSDKIQSILSRGGSFTQLSENFTSYLIKKQLFTPELLNRFDKVVMFKPLGQAEIYQIAKMKIEKLKKELYNLKRIKLEVEEAAIKKLASLGYNPEFGARGLERVIREKIEALIAARIIAGNVGRNKQIVLRVDEIDNNSL